MAIDGAQILAGAPDDDVGPNARQGSASVFFAPAPLPPRPPPTVPTGRPQPARPSISGFDFSPNVIAVGRRATPTIAIAKGGRFEYMLNAAARIAIVIERKLAGRREGRRCVKPRRDLKRRRKCARYKRAGTISRVGGSGRNMLSFSGRIGSRPLRPGSYRARIAAANAGGVSAVRTTSFRVVRAKKRRR